MRLKLIVMAMFCAGSVLAVDILPLSEVRPGMRGETWTVLKGQEVVRLETEILGIAEDRLAPGKHLIIGRLVDERVDVIGPVHGMSGSPLFVDGKLVGALSRRLGLFEKDNQCGFTPIEDMLELWDDEQKISVSGSSQALRRSSSDSGVLADAVAGDLLLLPVASGLREGWWLDFGRKLWEGTGMLLQAGGGGPGIAGSDAPGAPLEPGAPVAAALAVGDMVLAGTGTLTWRDGDRILAFGHPMLDLGSVTMPMCEAEIVTIIPSYMMPYKLSNTRREVGTVLLDRLSAISGVVGEKAELPTYDVSVNYAGRESRWRGRFFGNKRLSSVLMATLALRGLSAREDLPGEVFFQHRGSVVFVGGTEGGNKQEFTLKLDGAGSGDSSAWMNALINMLQRMEAVLVQNFLQITPESFEWSVEVHAGERMANISQIQVQPLRMAPGSQVAISVVLDNGRGKKEQKSAEFVVPHDMTAGETLQLRVLSARALDMERIGVTEVSIGGMLMTSLRRSGNRETQPNSVQEVFAEQNRVGRADELAVLVTRSGRAVRQGVNLLEGLPVSVAGLLGADARVEYLQEAVVAEIRMPVDAVVQGDLRRQISISQDAARVER